MSASNRDSGSLFIVSTPIGNLEDITFRAVRILKEVDLIAAEDTRVTRILLTRYDISTPLTSFHSYSSARKTEQLIEKMANGLNVALVSDAGTPGISDPAYTLVTAALEADLEIIPIPGASAVLPALVASGLPVHRFAFEGFLPQKKGRKKRIGNLETEERTLVFYESPHRIVKTVNELFAAWGDRRCVMAREITKKFETFFRGSFSELVTYLETSTIKGEFVLLVEGASSRKKNE